MYVRVYIYICLYTCICTYNVYIYIFTFIYIHTYQDHPSVMFWVSLLGYAKHRLSVVFLGHLLSVTSRGF